MAAVFGLVGSCGEEQQRSCRPCAEDEYCVEFGSDVAGEPNSFDCVELPMQCADDPTCACLEAEGGTTDGGVLLDFCFEEGGCDISAGVVHVTCPGG